MQDYGGRLKQIVLCSRTRRPTGRAAICPDREGLFKSSVGVKKFDRFQCDLKEV